MRIIAGSKRRLRLKTTEGREIRPTADRIKETLFNMIQNDLPGCSFLDLFAGTGQIGLEALSRGAKFAVFVDQSKKAAACIMDNIRSTKSEEESLLIGRDVFAAVKTLEGSYQFDIIFMDPPYGKDLEQKTLSVLGQSSLLKEDGMIIVEAKLGTDFSYLGAMGLELVKEKRYKTNVHAFIKRA